MGAMGQRPCWCIKNKNPNAHSGVLKALSSLKRDFFYSLSFLNTFHPHLTESESQIPKHRHEDLLKQV